MSAQEWSLVVGVVTSAVLAVGPWMFMVHAKLAVIASQAADLCDKLEKVSQSHERLWESHARHEARLDTHDVQISHISERLKDTRA